MWDLLRRILMAATAPALRPAGNKDFLIKQIQVFAPFVVSVALKRVRLFQYRLSIERSIFFWLGVRNKHW